jgi:hypothetical protein
MDHSHAGLYSHSGIERRIKRIISLYDVRFKEDEHFEEHKNKYEHYLKKHFPKPYEAKCKILATARLETTREIADVIQDKFLEMDSEIKRLKKMLKKALLKGFTHLTHVI